MTIRIARIALVAAAAVLSLGLRATASAPIAVAGIPASRPVNVERAAASAPIRLAIGLRYRHEDELRSLVDAQSTPGSPLAHHILSKEQFANYFAPSIADYMRTAAVLERHGLHVTATYANRSVIDVVAPAANVERAFATALAATRRSDGSTRYLNLSPAYLPADLATTVYGVVGFDTGERPRPAVRPIQRGLRPRVAPQPPLQGPATGFGPAAFANAYNFPVNHQIAGAPSGTTYDGAHQGVAIIVTGDFLLSDLQAYLQYFNIRHQGRPNRIPVNGGGGPPGDPYGVATLQVETLVGLSPGVTINDYSLADFTEANFIDAYNHIDNDDTSVVALSAPFSFACEDAPNGSFSKVSDYLALQGAALGITFVTNSGNYSLGSCYAGQFAPSTDPHFVSVGGSILLIDEHGHYVREVASPFTGGGASDIFARPTYQRNVPGVTGPHRNVPDIALDGDYHSGGAIYWDGSWETPDDLATYTIDSELAAALFASLIPQWTQMHGAPLGDIHGDLYATYLADGYRKPAGMSIYHDITLGSDGLGEAATPGYDHASGIGSIDGWNFALASHYLSRR